MSMDRVKQMISLKQKGLSYESIGKLFGISRQRIHQLISGYDKLSTGHNKFVKWYGDLRDLILERDEYTCQQCQGTDELIVHHLNGNDRNNSPSNLITICKYCHLNLHRH